MLIRKKQDINIFKFDFNFIKNSFVYYINICRNKFDGLGENTEKHKTQITY